MWEPPTRPDSPVHRRLRILVNTLSFLLVFSLFVIKGLGGLEALYWPEMYFALILPFVVMLYTDAWIRPGKSGFLGTLLLVFAFLALLTPVMWFIPLFLLGRQLFLAVFKKHPAAEPPLPLRPHLDPTTKIHLKYPKSRRVRVS